MEVDVTTVTSRGQVVIPQGIREREGITEGERFLVVDMDGTILLKRVKNLGSKTLDEFEKTFESLWQTAKSGGVTEKDAGKEIEASRKEKHERRDGHKY